MTTRLVAVGEQVRDDLVASKIGRAEQYVVVPPGVALADVPSMAEARRDLGLSPDAHVVAFVARLTSIKRPDRFADLALELAGARGDLTFVVAGEGEELAETRRRLAPLGERVRLLGWRSHVERIYAAADLVVLTSDNEGMPVSLIEAAMAGTPAVTTDVGSVREVVAHDETGLVTAPTVEALAAASRRLLADAALRERMGRAARHRAQERFSEQRLVDDTAALYEQLAVEKGLGRR
jgi:glycosyltransferase involved in cell wall biosynthesis